MKGFISFYGIWENAKTISLHENLFQNYKNLPFPLNWEQQILNSNKIKIRLFLLKIWKIHTIK